MSPFLILKTVNCHWSSYKHWLDKTNLFIASLTLLIMTDCKIIKSPMLALEALSFHLSEVMKWKVYYWKDCFIHLYYPLVWSSVIEEMRLFMFAFVMPKKQACHSFLDAHSNSSSASMRCAQICYACWCVLQESLEICSSLKPDSPTSFKLWCRVCKILSNWQTFTSSDFADVVSLWLSS